MTCIVAVAKEGKVYMGADTYGSSSNSGTFVGNPKCFINGEFLMGCTSTFRIIDLLTHNLTVPKVHEDEQSDPDKYIRTVFIEAVRKCFKDGGALETKSGIESGGNFLVGYRGNIYEVQYDFSVLNVPEYGASVGSGESAARGSLFTTYTLNEQPTPNERLITSLESAVAVVPSVRAPFVVLEL